MSSSSSSLPSVSDISMAALELPAKVALAAEAVQTGRTALREHLSPLVAAFAEICAILALAFCTAVSLNVFRQIFTLRDPTKPPEVFHYVPFIGCAISYGMDPLGFFERSRQKYGPVFSFPLPGRNVVVALGPTGSNFVLNSPHKSVNAEDAYTDFTTPVFGSEVVYDCPHSIFMQQKKFVKVGLTPDNFRRYVPMIATEVDQYLSKKVFTNDTKLSASFDPISVAGEITVCTAAATLQGREVRDALDETFAGLIHDLAASSPRSYNFVFPYLPLPSYRRRDRAQNIMRKFYLSILKNRRASNEEPPLDMLSALQNQHYRDGTPLTDKQIAHTLIALLMGGQHTSAATGAWAMLRLAERPELQESLYAEQVEVYGDGHGGLNPLDYETLQTPVLNSFIKELLRIHPPLHSLFCIVVEDIAVPKDVGSPAAEPRQPVSFRKHNEFVQYEVKKGSYVLAAPGFTAVDEQFWGRDGKHFRPEPRRHGSTKSLQQAEADGEQEDYGWGAISKGGKSPYLPFGAGRHRCIGEAFAQTQIATLIATLVREVKLSLHLGIEFPENDFTTMIVSPKVPRNVTFTRR
ncbi:hypothetical protein JCM11251_003737 [Rhodosporidiobolus azoricus]